MLAITFPLLIAISCISSTIQLVESAKLAARSRPRSDQVAEINLRHDKEIRFAARLMQLSEPKPNYLLKYIADSIDAYENGDILYEGGNLRALLDVLETLEKVGQRGQQAEPSSSDSKGAPDEARLWLNVEHIISVLFKGGKEQFVRLASYEKPQIADWKLNLYLYLKEYSLDKIKSMAA